MYTSLTTHRKYVQEINTEILGVDIYLNKFIWREWKAISLRMIRTKNTLYPRL